MATKKLGLSPIPSLSRFGSSVSLVVSKVQVSIQFTAHQPQAHRRQQEWRHGTEQDNQVSAHAFSGMRYCVAKPDDDNGGEQQEDDCHTCSRDCRNQIPACLQRVDQTPEETAGNEERRQRDS